VRRLAAFLGLLLLAGLLTPARAAVVRHASVEDLAERAVLAVLGTVKGHRATMAPGRGVLWTRHRIRVEKTLIGPPTRKLTVRVAGGRFRRSVSEVRGTAELRDGDRVVLFLWKDDAGEFRILGMAQGAFRVGEADTCTNSLQGLSLVDAEGRPVTARPLRLPLADLQRRVKAALVRKAEREAEERRARERVLAERARRATERTRSTRGNPGSPPE